MDGKLIHSMFLVLAITIVPSEAGLIHHWSLDEDTSATSTAVDSVGGLDGTIQGPESAEGKVGNAFSFDGSNNQVEIQGFAPPLQGTIVLWINPALARSKERFLGAGGDYELWLRGNGELKNELFDGGSATLGTGPGAVQADEWCQAAYTYDSATAAVEIYLDGELKVAGTAEKPSVPTATTLLLGHRAGASAGEHYGGLLDDVQIYDEVLTADQVMRLYDDPGSIIGGATVQASHPSPADEANDVPPDVILTWTPGIYVEGLSPRHRVFFGADFNDVNDGVGGIEQDAEHYPLDGSLDLDLGRTYYWRVDEANGVTGWDEGAVWQFTVANYLVVEDFEDYNDFVPDRIFDTWLDGWEDPANGSVVGFPEPPFTERTIVHSGAQSMPFFYDNSGPAYLSEAAVLIDDLGCVRDWTTRGVAVLSLWFRGTPPNAGIPGNQPEPMYAAIANRKGPAAVVYHDDPNATGAAAWTEWSIALQEFSDQGIDLTDIDKLVIGFGNESEPSAGGVGTMYIDDVRLYVPQAVPE